LTFFYNLISQGKSFIKKNQFLEILILIFIDSNIYLFENKNDLIQENFMEIKEEFRDFLMKLDYSQGWQKLQLKSGEDFSKCRFLNLN
jgi:hypothetical protein